MMTDELLINSLIVFNEAVANFLRVKSTIIIMSALEAYGNSKWTQIN